jgi:hypothetical protein
MTFIPTNIRRLDSLMHTRWILGIVILGMVGAGCSQSVDGPQAKSTPLEVPETPGPTKTVEAKESPKHEDPPNMWVTERPEWLGERVLPLGPNGMGVAEPTPPILRNRRFPTIEILPLPDRPGYHATIDSVPPAVLERSTWRPKCPVTPDELAYLTMTFWGFDHERHTGEMIVNASAADEITGVFARLYEVRFRIEEMRVATLPEQRAWNRAPTGDTNLTSSFECRKATGGSDWSEHAYGLAIDINPFHNPYLLGNIVGPELAGAYTDRTWKRPGMIFEGDAVTDAFDAIGWGWGGRWNSLKDWMHFSLSGH